jgi:hypothetical protein
VRRLLLEANMCMSLDATGHFAPASTSTVRSCPRPHSGESFNPIEIQSRGLRGVSWSEELVKPPIQFSVADQAGGFARFMCSFLMVTIK